MTDKNGKLLNEVVEELRETNHSDLPEGLVRNVLNLQRELSSNPKQRQDEIEKIVAEYVNSKLQSKR